MQATAKRTEKTLIPEAKNVYSNLTPEELIEHTIKQDQGILSNTGALCIKTGEFTGRSPKDRYIVKDDYTRDTVDWNDINVPFEPENYHNLRKKVIDYLKGKEIYTRDAYAGADPKYSISINVITEYPWSNLFAYNMFRRPKEHSEEQSDIHWTIFCAPGFKADREADGTYSKNFAIINFTEREILIGGTGYTGEIKKGIFSVLNYFYPRKYNIMSMHCSANVGKEGDTAIFFGLSGTGKTTLSTAPERYLIGDDEHGWSEEGVFNYEGGCYAKTIELSPEGEPEIYRAIKHGALLENIKFLEGTRKPDYSDDSITQNTRVSYPIWHIENIQPGSKGGHPKNIFFLTADAFGVLPPISRLTPGQAMYHFISGYTAKVAGTEEGVDEPQETFSACFGAPFMPLHPAKYAEMLGDKMQRYETKVWLVNTGWTGGTYGKGHRIKLAYTRAMITAALEGKLDDVDYKVLDIFGLHMPESCPNVPSEVLEPRSTWNDQEAYDRQAKKLANYFNKNFKKFEDQATDEMRSAAPTNE